MFGISFLFLSFSLGKYRYDAPVLASLTEINDSVSESIKSVILTNTYILTGVMLGAALANNNVAGDNLLTTPNLNA